MVKKATELIAKNVDRLATHAGLSNAAVEKKSAGRLTRSTVDRVRRGQGSAGVEVLGEIARTFGLELWQLCVRDLDPERLPALVSEASPSSIKEEDIESQVIARFRELSPSFQRLVLNDLDRYLEAECQVNDKKGGSAKRRA